MSRLDYIHDAIARSSWLAKGIVLLAVIAMVLIALDLQYQFQYRHNSTPSDNGPSATATLSDEQIATLRQHAFHKAAEYSNEQGGRAVLVMRDGRVVFEQYSNGFAAEDPHRLFSGTKSFWGIVIMCMIEDGLLTLDEQVGDAILEWHSDPEKRRITIRQLLELSSGLDIAYFAFNSPSIEHKFRYAIGLKLTDEPGRVFRYGPGHFYVLGVIIERKLEATTGENPLQYLKRRVLDPLKIEVAGWRQDAAGNPYMSTGASMTARNWARFGQWLLNGGQYAGKQILREDLVKQAFRPSRINPGYGLTFWLNRPIPIDENAWMGIRDTTFPRTQGFVLDERNRYQIAPNAPGDMVIAAGAGYQRLYIIPSLQMVVVRFGEDRHAFRDSEFLGHLLAAEQVTAAHAAKLLDD